MENRTITEQDLAKAVKAVFGNEDDTVKKYITHKTSFGEIIIPEYNDDTL